MDCEIGLKMPKKNDIFELKISDISTDGSGIGKVDGYTLFVKDAIIGDFCRVKVMKTKKTYGYAKLIDIITASPYRVKPVCPVARQCGGCQIQAMDYKAQLEFKQNLVRNNLKRIGGIEDGYEELPIIGMDEPYRYRNKAQYPVGQDRDGNLIMGFYAGHTHSIVECMDCKIGVESNEWILAVIKSWMELEGIEAYDENTRKGMVRHILIRTGFKTSEIMVCLVVNSRKLSDSQKASLVNRLTSVSKDSDKGLGGEIKSIMLNINSEDTNVILGRDCEILYGNGYIEDYIGEVKFRISPLSFFQVNPIQTEKLYGKVVEFAQLKGDEKIWDLYCGIGSISLFLAKAVPDGEVYGVEIIPEAIEDAKENARINNIDNAKFFVGKAEELVPDFYNKDFMTNPDLVVVDPPRKGCDAILLDTIVKMQPEKIVYVSCDSATLARDLRVLLDKGYELVKLQAVDQFCHSVHVETVVLLSQQN